MIFYRIWQKHFKICWKFFIYLIGQKYFPISTFLYLNKIWLKKLLIFSWCCLKFCHYNSIKCNFNLIIANFNYFRVARIFSIHIMLIHFGFRPIPQKRFVLMHHKKYAYTNRKIYYHGVAIYWLIHIHKCRTHICKQILLWYPTHRAQKVGKYVPFTL